ncbi:MAG: plasmid stabilization protein [Myxococcales bacterium]|nr:plasmid stabilization protein [Myxococcales bacterium]
MPAHTSLTIRKLAPEVKQRLRVRAAEHGRSMEEEAREILRAALSGQPGSGRRLVESIRRRFAAAGYVELAPPPRGPMREPPDFS